MSVRLTATLQRNNGDVLSRGMTERIKKIAAAEEAARKQAATAATAVTRAHFHYLRPANAPARRNRPTTGGRFGEAMRWIATPGPTGAVEFDMAEADKKARYWIILEIGTGESATLRRGGQKNPRGRPGKGASYVRSVKAQRGRRIAPTLAFGTGPRGTFTPPGAAIGQQLYLRRSLKNAPLGPHRAQQGLYISKEIKGQHFVRQGGEEGFRQYRTSVLAAARRAFAGKGYRP